MLNNRKIPVVACAAAGLVLAAALSGCSSSSATSGSSASPTTDTPSISAETAAFCQSLGDIQTEVVAPKPDMAQITTLLATMTDNAPDELASDIPVVSEAAQDPSQEPSPEFLASLSNIAAWAGDNCDAHVIEVSVSADGKLSDVPATAEAGLTVITATSADGTGTVGILRKSDGVTEPASELRQMPSKQLDGKLMFVGGGYPSGAMVLTPGNYVVAAFTQNGPPTDAVDMTVE